MTETMLNKSEIEALRLEQDILNQLLDSATCPNCNSPMSEEWEDEQDEVGEKTGYDYEIYSCNNCGYKVFL